jgi:hypothetical protein
MNYLTRFVLFLLCGLLLGWMLQDSYSVLAQTPQLLDKSFEGVSKNKNALQAKKEIMDEATEKVSENLIKEIIGDNKFNRNRSLIKERIIKNSARFIPFVRPGEFKSAEEESKMTVSFRVSVPDLQKLLLENGLFYESDNAPTIVPLLRWQDRLQNLQYSWWKQKDAQQKNLLARLNKGMEQALASAFMKNQFYIMQAQQNRYSFIFENVLSGDKVNSEDWSLLADAVGAQIILDGDMQIRKSTERSDAYLLDFRLTALQVMNSRSIADVSRQYETDVGSFDLVVDKKFKEISEGMAQDLASQVFEAWSRGTIGSSLYRLSLKGRLPLQMRDQFKEQMKLKLREIKNIKERLISSDVTTYELDSSLNPKELALKLKEFEMPPYRIILESSNELEIVYRLQRTQ